MGFLCFLLMEKPPSLEGGAGETMGFPCSSLSHDM